MTVNQTIKNLLKWGDVGKISKILDISSQAVTDRIKSKKEIDSVDFINAVCEVTGKDFGYFRATAIGRYSADDLSISSVGEDAAEYHVVRREVAQVREDAMTSAAQYWQSEYLLLDSRIKTKDQMIIKLEEIIRKMGG